MSLITPTASTSKPRTPIRSKLTTTTTTTTTTSTTSTTETTNATATSLSGTRRNFLSLVSGFLSPFLLFPVMRSSAASEEEYVKETEEVINKVRSTITMDKNDPNIDSAVTQLREASNTWVAKYRREKALLGRASFRDIYSALNAVSGHYISFGPTAPIPAKRKQRILEEMDTAEKSLSRGR